MYSESDIDGAVAAGAISADAAAALRAHIAAAHAAPAVDEEHFRLLTGFNDIFVSIAIVLLLVAVGQIGTSLARPLGGVFVAGTAWVLAEYFTAKRRMALPSILLLIAFVGGVAGGLFEGVQAIVPNLSDRVGALAIAGIGLATAGAAWLHWRRFMVPITVAAGAAAAAGLVLCLAVAAVPSLADHLFPLLLVAGVAVFAVAMWWDMGDRARTTRRSDVAFWLHLLAAPMLVHPIFAMLGMLQGTAAPAQAAVVILLYILLAVVALAIDRRALMVSALVYVLYALSSLIKSSGAVDLSFGLTALIIGSALLLLSAFWTAARRQVVGWLPGDLALKLPVVDRPMPA